MFEVLYRNECEEEKALRDGVILVFKDIEKMICPECNRLCSYTKKKNFVGNTYIKCDDCGFKILENNESDLHIMELRGEDYPLKDFVFKTGEKLCYDKENDAIWMYVSFVNILCNAKIEYQPFYYRFTIDAKNKTATFFGPKLVGKGVVYGNNPFTEDDYLSDIFSKEMILLFAKQLLELYNLKLDTELKIKEILPKSY